MSVSSCCCGGCCLFPLQYAFVCVRDNFVIIYELLDECSDNGCPQTTESRILRLYITQEGNRMAAAPRPPIAVTNAVSWRSEGIKHR